MRRRKSAASPSFGGLSSWGPIFNAQGWDTSPFNVYPAKGENMWRDLERRTAKYGLPFNRPDAR